MRTQLNRLMLLLAPSACALLLAIACSEAAPAPTARDAAVASSSAPLHLGSRERPLLWTPEEQQSGYANMDRLYPTRAIQRVRAQPRPAFPLPVELRDLTQVKVNDLYSLADFRERYRVAGMLVVSHGKIVYEQYAYGHSPTTRWTSWSIAKSVVALLVGAALKDGYIASLQQSVAAYIPSLAHSAYADVTIQQLLQMRSGVAWTEDYGDTNSDVNRLGDLLRRGGTAVVSYLAKQPRVAPPGQAWHYNSGESHLLGSLLRAAVGDNLSSYLSRKIWSRFAMQDDGYWVLEEEYGAENGSCCFSATLRDYARIGLFALHGGKLPDGSEILPTGYMDEATKAWSDGPGYGYQFWVHDGSYSARGVFGQEIRIYPADEMVVVTHALAKQPGETFDYAGRLFDGIRKALLAPKLVR
jgi:CubicO group peptidase (beta-lactamase class C family)